jgi:hypothetical protein
MSICAVLRRRNSYDLVNSQKQLHNTTPDKISVWSSTTVDKGSRGSYAAEAMELLRIDTVAAASSVYGAPGWTSVNAGVKLVRSKGLIGHSHPPS